MGNTKSGSAFHDLAVLRSRGYFPVETPNRTPTIQSSDNPFKRQPNDAPEL